MAKAGKRPPDDAPAPPDLLTLTPAQVEVVRQPISIGLMTGHFFGSGYAHELENCDLEDVPLRCTYKDPSLRPDEEIKKLIEEADALWYHAPNSCMMSVSRKNPHKCLAAFSPSAAGASPAAVLFECVLALAVRPTHSSLCTVRLLPLSGFVQLPGRKCGRMCMHSIMLWAGDPPA